MSTNKPKTIPVEVLHKEIDLIQDIIKRMANNSFLIKGWMISVFTAAMVLLKDKILTDAMLFISPTIIFAIAAFWYIDAFFLHKEKCYRALYDHVISNIQEGSRAVYSLDYRPFQKSEESVFDIMINNTVWPFYVIPILLNFAAILYVLTATG